MYADVPRGRGARADRATHRAARLVAAGRQAHAERRRRRKTGAVGADGEKKPNPTTVFTKPVEITKELCVFLGLAAGTQVSRSDVTRGVMKYAKDHKLTDKQTIKPDATLRKLLGLTEQDNLTILNLQKYLKGHYVKAVVPA